MLNSFKCLFSFQLLSNLSGILHMFWRIPYSYPQKTIQKLNSGDNSLIISRMQNIKKKPDSMRGEVDSGFFF